MPIFIEGFMISFGLIVAIGPQNAYLLRQGLRQRHVLPVATVCFLSDILLIGLGVFGTGKIIAENEALSTWMGWGGAVFLLWFALKSAKSALKPEAITQDDIDASAGDAAGQGVKIAILHTLAFTFLNPWVYVDTMVLIGGVSIKYETDALRNAFMIGAWTASAIWFYGLAYGAKKAAPLFRKKITWRILDSLIAIIMLAVCATLIQHQLS
ncbi:amino acid transporter [Kordiimonas sp. SCSIO 12603]|uniref:LysE/ArgO family amino acid transporter n=1 Tax=Kordiimonas sp. SCSIO 12603 TaxID=2829596 RepID=UPI00210408A6|nr:LysE/ArgO family amino acid transporter [Kordiimonas sp. SCSIO 12603]UTW58127.1 amino acid transporter [Kordiimonas sp. SCSIO 12603]